MVIHCLTIRLAVNKIKINYYVLKTYKIFKVKMLHSIIIQLKNNVFHAQIIVWIALLQPIANPALHIW